MEMVLHYVTVFGVSYAAGSIVVYILSKIVMHYVNKGLGKDDDDEDLEYE